MQTWLSVAIIIILILFLLWLWKYDGIRTLSRMAGYAEHAVGRRKNVFLSDKMSNPAILCNYTLLDGSMTGDSWTNIDRGQRKFLPMKYYRGVRLTFFRKNGMPNIYVFEVPDIAGIDKWPLADLKLLDTKKLATLNRTVPGIVESNDSGVFTINVMNFVRPRGGNNILVVTEN